MSHIFANSLLYHFLHIGEIQARGESKATKHPNVKQNYLPLDYVFDWVTSPFIFVAVLG